MRCCHVIIFLVAFVGFGGGHDVKRDEDEEFQSENGEVSYLQIVYDELAKITRITNAISLQAAAIRKSVKVRNVIAELMKVDTNNFTELINYKPENLHLAIQDLFDKTKELSEKVTNDTINEMNSGKPSIESLKEAKDHFLHINDEGAEIKVQEFFEEIENSNFVPKMSACDSSILSRVAKFFNILAGKSDELEDQQKNFILEMGNQEAEILKCLDNSKSYSKILNSTLQKYEIFQHLKSAMDVMSNLNQSSEAKISRSLNILLEIFGYTKGIRSTKNARNSGAIFREALLKLNVILASENFKPELSLTLGFPGTGDMAKVAKDLQSKWFLEKVARGKSIEELRKGLQGFFKFGELMKTLEDSWKIFKDGFHRVRRNGANMAKAMLLIEKHQRQDSLDDRKLKSSISSIGSCWKKLDTFNSASLNVHNQNMKPLGEMIEQILKISNEAQEITVEVDRQGVQSVLSKIQNIDLAKYTLKTLKNEIKNQPNYESLKTLGNHFAHLQVYQNHFSKDVAKNMNLTVILENATLEIMKILRTSELTSTLKCLDLQKFPLPSEILKMISFANSVYSISNRIEYNETLSVLNSFSKMKQNVLDAEKFVKDLGLKYQKEHQNAPNNPVLKLEHSQEMALSLGRGMYVLRDMVRAHNSRSTLQGSLKFDDEVNTRIQMHSENRFVKEFWNKRDSEIHTLMEELEELNNFAGTVKDRGLLTMRKILDEAIKVHGFQEVFKHVKNQLGSIQIDEKTEEPLRISEKLSHLDMDFAAHKGYLHAASLSFDELKIYFDEIFGLNHHPPEVEHNYLAATLICIGIFILIIISIFLIYSLTPNGRKRYKHLYFYYFGKPEDFEKRWRYSLFMDRQDGKNALLDAAREINPTNVLKAVKKGAYINVYNKYGNTPLHVATKRGYHEIVEILIRNGADRTLLNAQNKMAEELLVSNIRDSTQTIQNTQTTQTTENTERSEQVEKIFKKYQKKKYRNRVPEIFPVISFHIYIEKSTNDELTIQFMDKFQAITTTEALPTTTHCIVKTEPDGTLKTDDLDLLVWILNGVIIVKDTWMSDCLKDENLIGKDWEYLVEKVKYKGIEYDTIGQWTQTMAKGQMPFLCGVHVFVTIPDYKNLITLASIVTVTGGTMCSRFPDKSRYNIGAHPYLHAHLGPLFLIHDGKSSDLEEYKNDKEMYTLFTEEEFVHFMLKREMNIDRRPNPIPLTNDADD